MIDLPFAISPGWIGDVTLPQIGRTTVQRVYRVGRCPCGGLAARCPGTHTLIFERKCSCAVTPDSRRFCPIHGGRLNMPKITVPCRIRPTRGKIVLKPCVQTKTLGGLHLPENARKQQAEGIVVRVGESKILDDGTEIPADVCEGEKVRHTYYSGSEVKIDDEEYLIVNFEDVVCAIE